MTNQEEKAINILRVLSMAWPESLVLVVSGGGTLSVKRDQSEVTDDLAAWETLATIQIPANAMA